MAEMSAGDCFLRHAQEVVSCLEFHVTTPWIIPVCIQIADFNLSVCLSKAAKNHVEILIQNIENIADALWNWAQQNPGAATGAVVIVGTVAAVAIFGPGGLAFAFL